MDVDRRTVAELFALIDGDRLPPAVFTRAVLERILYLEPGCARARELLDELDGAPLQEDRVLAAIEEAEELAAHGVWYGARALAEEVRRLYPHQPVARAWLEGLHLLLEG